MRDKDIAGILRSLLPVVDQIVVTSAPSTRASAPEELARAVQALDATRPVAVEPDPVRAVEHAWTHGRIVCVAGSIFLAGAVRSAFYPRAIVDSPF